MLNPFALLLKILNLDDCEVDEGDEEQIAKIIFTIFFYTFHSMLF